MELRCTTLSQPPLVSALHDPSTGVTDAVLSDARKQSVVDAERLLSHHVAPHMKEKGFTDEAKYVKTTADWHEASDGRGIPEASQRMLQYLVEDWLPWHRDGDYSTVDKM